MPNHSSPRLPGAVRAAMALGIVMLLTACGGGGGPSSVYSQACAEPGCNATPSPPLSRLVWTILGRGEIARTTTGCRLRMPKVEIEEINGYGGRLQGSDAFISFYDSAGTFHFRVEAHLNSAEVELQLGTLRYEGRAKRTVELVFEPRIDLRTLQAVDWDIGYYEDTQSVLDTRSIRIELSKDQFDLGPGL